MNLKLSLICYGSLLILFFLPLTSTNAQIIIDEQAANKTDNYNLYTNPSNASISKSSTGIFDNQSMPIDSEYVAKFVCGTITGSEGPLRPGHYDTDISIYNKQAFPSSLFWYVVNNETISNSFIREIPNELSFNIVCKDITALIKEPSNFTEGFVIIKTQQLGSSSVSNYDLSATSPPSSPIDVQVFYTANALENLPKELVVDKYTFKIVDDPSQKIPRNLINTTLELSLHSNLNELQDQKSRIISYLSTKYNLTNPESLDLQIVVNKTDSSVGVMIDDHAISLSRLSPSFVYTK